MTDDDHLFSDGVNFVWQPWKRKLIVDDLIEIQPEVQLEDLTRSTFRLYNKLPESQAISNKKTFFTHLQNYYVE